jgi:hypothetical protein
VQKNAKKYVKNAIFEQSAAMIFVGRERESFFFSSISLPVTLCVDESKFFARIQFVRNRGASCCHLGISVQF